MVVRSEPVLVMVYFLGRQLKNGIIASDPSRMGTDACLDNYGVSVIFLGWKISRETCHGSVTLLRHIRRLERI